MSHLSGCAWRGWTGRLLALVLAAGVAPSTASADPPDARSALAAERLRQRANVTRTYRSFGGVSQRGRPLGVRTTRIVRGGQTTTVHVLRQELSASEHARVGGEPHEPGRTIEYNEYDHALVRRDTRDTPVQNGRFERTVVTTVQRVEPGAPAPWHRDEAERTTPRVRPREARYLVSRRPLGVTYRGNTTRVTMFAPRARQVFLVVGEHGEQRIPMQSNLDGTWHADVDRPREQMVGQRYHLEVDGQRMTDPNAHAVLEDYGDAVFADLHSFRWNDANYLRARANNPRIMSPRSVLSEVHVRDMSADESAPVEPGERGTYAGFSAPRVVEHYAALGPDAVEILPVHNYDDHSGDRGTENHWGYMTSDFHAPEIRYAQNARNAPGELQSAVDAYHQRGVGVVMDVVFNHTAAGPVLHYTVLDREYYFRLQPDGVPHNGAGTGNELRSESPMVRRMIVASLRHFARNYHIDGFRFDLGSLIDVDTMREIDRALPRDVFVTAEPWAAEYWRARWDKSAMTGALRNTRVSVWNDNFRNNANRFMLGQGGNDEARWALMTGIAGSMAGERDGFAERPSQVVNYLTSHDECTPVDRIGVGCNGAPPALPGSDAGTRAVMGSVLLLGSRGHAMLDHGQEFLRSKQGISNAHNQDNAISHINWKMAQQNRSVVAVHQRLIQLRNQHPTFGEDRGLHPDEVRWLTPDNRHALGWMYTGRTASDASGSGAAPHLLYLTNSDPHNAVTFELPHQGDWNVEVFGTHVGQDPNGTRTARGTITVPPGTGVVLTQPLASSMDSHRH